MASPREEKDGLEVGQVVRVVAESPDYERFEELVEITDSSQVVEVVMKKKGVPQRLVIKPSDDKDEVFADDKRLGLGPQAFEGIVGQVVIIKVVPFSGAAAITKAVTLDGTQTLVAIATPGELLVSLDPTTATLTSTAGTIEIKSPGLVAVKDLEIGATFEIEAKAPGYKSAKQSFTQSQAQATLALKLEKEAGGGGGNTVAPSGKGTLSVAAKPWAQVQINGKQRGTTPIILKDLPAGKYTVVLTKGEQKVTRTPSPSGA